MGYNRTVMAFSIGLAVRTLLVAGLAFLALWLALGREMYATALVVGAVIALLTAEVARHVASADRLLARFVDTLATEGDERPAMKEGGTPRLDAAIERALDRVSDARVLRQRRIDYLESLCDTVAAALVVIDGEGRVEVANRAAHTLLPGMSRLSDLGEQAAGRLNRARFGAGEVLRLKDGRVMFAMVTGFTAGGGQRRLVSLQRVAGDLDAVELRAWSDLVRVLSHEMMNSLTPICSLAESGQALLAGQGGEAAEILEVIARRSAGLMTFVERYREVFDVPAPERRPIALGDIFARTGSLMAAQMAEAGVAFTVACEAPRIPVDADPVLMDQAIINLLKNALEAVRDRPEAAVSLTATIEAAHAVIEVADNGPGLAPEDVEAVFVPFFTRKAGGSGVGLSIVRQIALSHGGAVEYRAAFGGGAVFSLSLPLAI
jgi:nitrogen fixation/metabolism regulation signal transduction histidine kinase